ncbi:MAG: YbaN family protein [Clostridiales bacterium]|nr:YbaN family protein [Clostridiales bacterium]
MKKILLLTCGGLCLVFAAIGLFLPIWPTTPFVLLSASCFSVYPPIYERIRRVRFFREYLDCYRNGMPVSFRTRTKSIVILWIALVLSMVFAKRTFMYVLLPCVGIAVTIHLLLMGRGKGGQSGQGPEKERDCP